MTWMSNEQIQSMGFASVGKNLKLSDKASFYNCQKIQLGNNVRIDDFCVLSAGVEGIEIGNYIHIGVFSSLIGAGNILLSDFCNISSRVSIYSSNDDYCGRCMTNPTIPLIYRNVQHDNVKIGRHVIIGSGSIVLPGTTLEEGAAVGALSLVKNSCISFGIYAGIPAKKIAMRRRDLLKFEQEMFDSMIEK